jgi:predicted NBD/HSP70 family sugar kinase
MAEQCRITVGIDLRGSSIRIGLFDGSMRMLDSYSVTTRVAAGPQGVVDEMADAVRLLLKRKNIDGCVYESFGVPIGSPGPINLPTAQGLKSVTTECRRLPDENLPAQSGA